VARKQDSSKAVFEMLSDQTRLGILKELAKGEINVGELCQRLKLRQPACSHHLGLLRMAGLVDSRRQGKLVFYTINREPLASVRKLVASLTGDAVAA
jgi:DNA-binding transcriptional ArsR family regulator